MQTTPSLNNHNPIKLIKLKRSLMRRITYSSSQAKTIYKVSHQKCLLYTRQSSIDMLPWVHLLVTLLKVSRHVSMARTNTLLWSYWIHLRITLKWRKSLNPPTPALQLSYYSRELEVIQDTQPSRMIVISMLLTRTPTSKECTSQST